jgi:hypothetical protein
VASIPKNSPLESFFEEVEKAAAMVAALGA